MWEQGKDVGCGTPAANSAAGCVRVPLAWDARSACLCQAPKPTGLLISMPCNSRATLHDTSCTSVARNHYDSNDRVVPFALCGAPPCSCSPLCVRTSFFRVCFVVVDKGAVLLLLTLVCYYPAGHVWMRCGEQIGTWRAPSLTVVQLGVLGMGIQGSVHATLQFPHPPL